MKEKSFSERVQERAFYPGELGEDPRDVVYKNLMLVAQFCKERAEEIALARMNDRSAPKPQDNPGKTPKLAGFDSDQLYS